MAYPDYSIVIISVTENGVTNDYAKSFFNDEFAKKFYNQAVSEGKRAFYYEKPKATRFVRNDSQPLKTNNEKGLENQPIQSIEGEEQDAGELVEEIYQNASTTFNDAVGTVRNIQKLQLLVARRFFDTVYVGPFKFLKKTFNRLVNEPSGVVIGTETITNKRITWSHNGSGGVAFSVEKLWPDKDEITWTPPLEENPIQVVTDIEGNTVSLGTRRNKKVHDGTETGGVVTEVYTWVPAGLTIYISQSSNLDYLSNGDGTYSTRDRTNTNCDPIGTVYSQVSQNDIMYNLSNAGGPDEEVKIGDIFVELVADGDCGESEASRTVYYYADVTVYEDEHSVYQTLGDGGVIQRPRIIIEPINYNSPCGPMQIGTSERYFDGTQGETITYFAYGTEVGRCQGLIYFSNTGGEVYTVEEPQDPDGGNGGGGGSGGDGEVEVIEDPEHATNGQFEEYEIAANYSGEHPFNAYGERHLVRLDPDSGLWVAEEVSP